MYTTVSQLTSLLLLIEQLLGIMWVSDVYIWP